MTKTIVVHGASGHLGRMVVDELLSRGQPPNRIVLPVRSPDSEHSRSLSLLGCSVQSADFMLQPSLERVYKGAHTVVFIPIPGTNLERVSAAEHAVRASKNAGVTRFVCVSFGNSEAGVESYCLLQPAVLYTEALVQTSGLKYLIIRMGLFAENNEGAFRAAVESGTLSSVAKGTDRAPYIMRRDVARGIAAAAMNFELEGRTYDLEGSSSVSWDELAGMMSAATGKTIKFKSITTDELQKKYEPSMGDIVARDMAGLTASLNKSAAEGEFKVTNDMFELTGKQAEPINTYLFPLSMQKGKETTV